MKTILFVAMALTSSAYAGVCDVSYTFDIENKVIRESKNHSAFTKLEKAMIAEAVKETMGEENPDVALEVFADVMDDTLAPGPGAGEIQYMMDDGKLIALVHFWPGDTEVGMIFTLTGGLTYKRLAVIGDSHIDCN